MPPSVRNGRRAAVLRYTTREQGRGIMQIYEELKQRGLIAQVTDEEEIRDLINQGKATFYIGF